MEEMHELELVSGTSSKISQNITFNVESGGIRNTTLYYFDRTTVKNRHRLTELYVRKEQRNLNWKRCD